MIVTTLPKVILMICDVRKKLFKFFLMFGAIVAASRVLHVSAIFL